MCSKVHTQCGSMPIFSLHGQWWQKYTHSEKERDRDRTTKTGLARQTNSDDNDRKKKQKTKLVTNGFMLSDSACYFFSLFSTPLKYETRMPMHWELMTQSIELNT